MAILWATYWPMVIAAIVVGLVVGRLYHGRLGAVPDRAKRVRIVALGLVLLVGATALFHGPLGAAERAVAKVETTTRRTLAHYEMGQVEARMVRAPIRRDLFLKGPADDFQRAELVRMFSDIPGVDDVRWNHRVPFFPLPLWLEAELMALVGFLAGLVLAYIVELRRRSHRWDRY